MSAERGFSGDGQAENESTSRETQAEGAVLAQRPSGPPNAAKVHVSTRYCENCGCNAYEMAQPSPGYWRKECAECGSCGPFMAENPHYGPGNPDWEHDRAREDAHA